MTQLVLIYCILIHPSSEQRCPSLEQPRPGLRERFMKEALPVVCGWWWPSVLVESFSHKKRWEKYHAYVELQAFAGACVQQTSGFLLNTTTWKSLTIATCCFCLIWKMLQLWGEKCQPTWGPFLERSILFGPTTDATNPYLSSKWPHFISNPQILR